MVVEVEICHCSAPMPLCKSGGVCFKHVFCYLFTLEIRDSWRFLFGQLLLFNGWRLRCTPLTVRWSCCGWKEMLQHLGCIYKTLQIRSTPTWIKLYSPPKLTEHIPRKLMVGRWHFLLKLFPFLGHVNFRGGIYYLVRRISEPLDVVSLTCRCRWAKLDMILLPFEAQSYRTPSSYRRVRFGKKKWNDGSS